MEHDRLVACREKRLMERTFILNGPQGLEFDINLVFGLFVSRRHQSRSVVSFTDDDLHSSYQQYLQALQLCASQAVKVETQRCPNLLKGRRKLSPTAVLAIGQTAGTKEDIALMICAPKVNPAGALSEIQAGINLLFREKLRMN